MVYGSYSSVFSCWWPTVNYPATIARLPLLAPFQLKHFLYIARQVSEWLGGYAYGGVAGPFLMGMAKEMTYMFTAGMILMGSSIMFAAFLALLLMLTINNRLVTSGV